MPNHDAPPTEVRATFRDPALEARFRRDGYVVVDLPEPTLMDHIAEPLRALLPERAGPFFGPYRPADSPERRAEIDALVRTPMFAAVGPLFEDYRPWMGAMLAKHPGEDSYLGLHHDDTRVDEDRFVGVVAWTPIEDTGPEFGGLFVVAGSHLLPAPRRGTPRGVRELAGVERLLERRYLTHLTVKRGQVVVYDNRLIHGSNTLGGDATRIAAAIALVPREAELLYCLDTPSGETLELEVADDYFLHLDPPESWGAADSTWLPSIEDDRVLKVRGAGHTARRQITEEDLTILTPMGTDSVLDGSGSGDPAVIRPSTEQEPVDDDPSSSGPFKPEPALGPVPLRQRLVIHFVPSPIRRWYRRIRPTR